MEGKNNDFSQGLKTNFPISKTPKENSTSPSSLNSTGFELNISPPNYQLNLHQKNNFKIATVSKWKIDKSPKNTAGGCKPNVYCMPKSYEETGSLRAVLDDVHFVKLASTTVKPGDRPDGSIVGVLMLFNRTDLKLFQPKVLLQNSLLGAMTNLEALGYFGFKVPPKQVNHDNTTIVSLLSEQKNQQLFLVQLILFDDKLLEQLRQANYPFPVRSSFDTFSLPELKQGTQVGHQSS